MILEKSKKSILIINMVLLAILFGLISLNKDYFRPEFSHLPFVSILTGCFPNFIAAFIISLAFANGVIHKNPKNSRLIIYSISILVSAILILEEIMPLWGASTQYDFYDILASIIGSATTILIFELIRLKTKSYKIN